MNNILAPLLEKILKYGQAKVARLHIPGHRQGKGLPRDFKQLAPELFKLDLTELPGLDDLHHPRGVIARAQALAAKLYGAQQTFFLVNGTSGGLHASIMAAVREGGKVIVPRNAHRSVFGGLVLSGAVPVYLEPKVVPRFAFPAGIKESDLAAALAGHPECQAVLAVHPTYYGTVGDLSTWVEKAHAVDKPVIVDEAHGTHLYFTRHAPPGALRCGADVVVQSVHKTGGSLTQSSWLHLQGERLAGERLKDCLRLVQTTSPSYILMASLDAARRQLAVEGEVLLEKALQLANMARREISRIKGLEVLVEEYAEDSFCGLDPTRLVVRVWNAGYTGFQAKHLLHTQYRVDVEMADFYNLVAVIGLGTTREDVLGLVRALRDLAGRGQKRVTLKLPDRPPVPPLKVPPRRAFWSRTRPVSLEEAAGRVSGEMVCVYPPGIPAVCPGEEITPEIRDYLLAVRQYRLYCQGPADQSLATIRILVD